MSPDLIFINQIKSILRPTDVPDYGMLCDILWSDPDENLKDDFGENERGISFTYSKKTIEKFLKDNQLDLICRAHQVVEDGYEFFGNKILVTVFSAPNYCDMFDNCGAMMCVDENLVCGFKILQPRTKGTSNLLSKELMRSLTPPKKRSKEEIEQDEKEEEEEIRKLKEIKEIKEKNDVEKENDGVLNNIKRI